MAAITEHVQTIGVVSSILPPRSESSHNRMSSTLPDLLCALPSRAAQLEQTWKRWWSPHGLRGSVGQEGRFLGVSVWQRSKYCVPIDIGLQSGTVSLLMSKLTLVSIAGDRRHRSKQELMPCRWILDRNRYVKLAFADTLIKIMTQGKQNGQILYIREFV